MDSSKIVQYLSKLLIEDDEADLVRFTFLDQTKKIKSSKSFLSQISPVFEKMFSETWLKESTIQLADDVPFDQYSTFKLFLEIIYGLREVDSLSVDESTAVYFYSHKYQVTETTDKIQAHLNERMAEGVNNSPLTVSELNEALQFAELYELKDFKVKLDEVRLDFDEQNPVQFFNVASKFQLDSLRKQIVQHLKCIEPNDTWTLEISNLVVKCLQTELLEKKVRPKKRKFRNEWTKHMFELTDVMSYSSDSNSSF